MLVFKNIGIITIPLLGLQSLSRKHWSRQTHQNCDVCQNHQKKANHQGDVNDKRERQRKNKLGRRTERGQEQKLLLVVSTQMWKRKLFPKDEPKKLKEKEHYRNKNLRSNKQIKAKDKQGMGIAVSPRSQSEGKLYFFTYFQQYLLMALLGFEGFDFWPRWR